MENMRTEAIELFKGIPIRLDVKAILEKVLKGALVATSVWITASIVSKEETINLEAEKTLSPIAVEERDKLYFGAGSEVTEGANSILEMMENHIGLTKAVLNAREQAALNGYESISQKLDTAGTPSAVILDSGTEEMRNPSGNADFSNTGDSYILKFEGKLPSDYCVGSTVDLSGITLLYGEKKILLEEATVEIPDTGKAGNYNISVEYNGSKIEIPFGVTDYKVYLNGNGGICDTDTLYLTDYIMKDEIIPSRLGKEFTGWYRDEACTIPFEGAERGETVLELYAGWKDYTGFLCDEEGYITSFTGENYKIKDGLLVLPNEEGCVGIRAGALNNLSNEIFEIYVPAGMTDIEPGALENLSSLFYIEVDPGNPVYVSKDGILYNKETGTLVLLPAGR